MATANQATATGRSPLPRRPPPPPPLPTPEAAAEETARQEATRNENFVAEQRRTWAQVKDALEYMGTPFTQGNRGSPTRETGDEVLGAALKWWKKVFCRHPDKMQVSPLALEVTEEEVPSWRGRRHMKLHGWWATDGDSGRREVVERNRRGAGSLPWKPYGGTTPPRPDFINELLCEQH